MNFLKIGWALFAVVALGVGCAGTVSNQSGSNSNWLETCLKDADCSGAFQCWCGTCTSVCTADADCGKLPSGATCASPETANAVCGGSATTRACVLPCDLPEPPGVKPCAVLGANASCTDGVCRAPSSTTTTDGGSLTCSERSQSAADQAHNILVGADKSCGSNADCVLSAGAACSADPCEHRAMSKAGAAAVAPALASVDQRVCDPFAAAGCATPIANCPNAGVPTCFFGSCVEQVTAESEGGILIDSGPAPLPRPATDAGSCATDTAEMAALISAAEAKADQRCSVDADCTSIPDSNACYGSCLTAVSNAGASALANEIASLGSQFCGPFLKAGCQPAYFSCPALHVKCVSGQCQGCEVCQ